jgi:hypothetical protein
MAVEFYALWDGNSIRPEMGIDREEATAIPVNKRVKVRVTQARSLPHHRALYGSRLEIIKQWPEDYPYQPANENELIAWLKVMAGHRIATFVKVESPEQIKAMKAAYEIERKNSNYVWLIEKKGGVEIVRPDSVSFEALDEIEFSKVFNAISDVLAKHVGLSLDDIIQYLKDKNSEKKRIAA